MNSISLIKKNQQYYSDMKKAGESVPRSESIASLGAIISYLVWGTSFSEYFGYKFWQKTCKEKKLYMTRRHMFRFFDRYNPPEFRNRIGDKSIAPKYYGRFLHREQVEKEAGFESFVDFCNRYNKIFIKKKVGWGGESARAIDASSPESIKRAWEALTDEFVAEPLLENCEDIKAVYPESLNTVKATVLQTKNGPVIVTAIIRFGNNTTVDNVHSGGMAAGISIETGRIETPAMDKHFKKYTCHPVTGKQITGLVIPSWNEVKKLAIEASLVTPQLRYTSWDIALTIEGPVMVEGNWDAEFYMEQTLYNRGHRKLFIDLLEG
jgi:hypothetical protein